MRAFTADVGPHLPRALRRHRREAAPLPLRHAGELARPHRGAAREQRAAHRARDARRHAVEGRAGARRSSCRAGTRRSACRRRGTSSGRCASSRCSRTSPTCSSTATCSKGRRSSRRKVAELCEAAEAELQWVLDGGGSFAMIDEMKGRLVQSHAERVRRIESGELKVVGVNAFTETEPSPLADERAARRHRDDRPRGRARAGRGDRGVARRRATTPRSTRALATLRRGRGDRPRTSCPRRSRSPRPAAPSASGPARCARCSASTARPTGVGAVAVAARRRDARRCGRRCRRSPSATGRPDPAPRRQARPRRPLQRRRADRGRGPRRRDGGRLPGHPAHARPRSRPRPATRTSTSSASRSSRARTSPWCPRRSRLLREAGVDAPVVVGGIIPDADRAQLEAHGRGPGLHTQGLPAGRDHGRHRRPRPAHRIAVLRPGQPPADEKRDAGPATRRRRQRRPRRARRRRRRRRDEFAVLGGRRRRGRRDRGRSPASRSAPRARQSEDRLGAAEDEIRARAPRARVDQRGAARRSEPPRRRSRSSARRAEAASRERSEHAFDAATGLYDEQYFAVLVQQQVAAARRSLRPVSVVIFEIDGMGEADRETQAAGARRRRRRRAAHAARERRRVPPRRPDGRRDPRGHPRSRRGVGRRARARHAAREPGRRRAHVVGRRRVLPDARARRGRARAPGRAARSTKRAPAAATASSSRPKT